MINSDATFQTVDQNGNFTAQNLIQKVTNDLNSAAPALHFHFEFHDPGNCVVPIIDFRMALPVVNSMVQALNGTVSVGFDKTDDCFEAAEIDGAKPGCLLVVAENIATPKQTSPINFSLTFTPNSGKALTPIPFQLTHVDASLLVGLINAVANTN